MIKGNIKMKTNLNKIVIFLGLIIGVNTCAMADIAADAVLKYTDGSKTCTIGADATSATGCLYDVQTVAGSYFGMDTSGDGIIQDGEKTVLTGVDGVTIGTAQAGGSIDAGWSFGGAPGEHFTTQGLSVTGTGNTASLAMAGWTVNWNGGDIDMGAGLTGSAGGFASITCGVDCSAEGDTFTLDYAANVPTGLFAGFYYTLHLEGCIGGWGGECLSLKECMSSWECSGAPSPIPVPPAIWLFGSGLIGLIGFARKK